MNSTKLNTLSSHYRIRMFRLFLGGMSGSVAQQSSGRTLDSWSRGCGFESYPLRCRAPSRARRSRTPASVSKQYNFELLEGRWCSEARKLTVGLASHWPCVTSFVLNTTCGFKEMSTHICGPMECGTSFTYLPIYDPPPKWPILCRVGR